MPFRVASILMASDLSPGADDVLRTAGAFAALTEAELHVVHASESAGNSQGTGEDPVDATERLREQVLRALPRDAMASSTRVQPGRPHEVILRRAGEVDADLIVLGPYREGMQRQVLGTTADRVVRTSDQPCLIVHRPVSLPLRRVLVPSDLSDAARGAMDLGLIWASALRLPTRNDEKTAVDVIHIIRGASSMANAEKALRDEVSAAVERTGVAAGLSLNELVLEGESPAEAILRHATDSGADLLVLGTHGEGETARALIGSVSSAVARRAGCAVLLVPPAWWKTRQALESELGQPPRRSPA